MDDWLSGFFEMNPQAAPIDELPQVKTKTYVNDVFKDVLPALDRRDINYYGKLTDAQKKDISIWTLTRWMSSTTRDTAMQLYTVNEVANKDSIFFSSKKFENALETSKHKELQWMLLALCGTGKPERHLWPAAPRGVKKEPLVDELLKFYPLLKDDDVALLLQLNSKEELTQFFKDNGYDDKSIKELFKGKAKA